jgi:hypothetical protein
MRPAKILFSVTLIFDRRAAALPQTAATSRERRIQDPGTGE